MNSVETILCVFDVETKDQWARDDPAFLVLVAFWLVGK